MLFPILLSLAFAACQSDTHSDPSNMRAVPGEPAEKPTSFEDMKASALSEDDVFGRAENSLIALQTELTKAEGKVPGLGKVTVFLDENLNMLLKNETSKETLETVVNLRHLNPDGLRLIPDNAPGEYPGLAIAVLDGMPGVTIRKGREVVSEERELVIFLPQRHNIEAITAPISAALNVAHGRY